MGTQLFFCCSDICRKLPKLRTIDKIGNGSFLYPVCKDCVKKGFKHKMVKT